MSRAGCGRRGDIFWNGARIRITPERGREGCRSGEVEGGHRHGVQARLKLSGCWWKEQSAQAVLHLRVTRANNLWDGYGPPPKIDRQFQSHPSSTGDLPTWGTTARVCPLFGEPKFAAHDVSSQQAQNLWQFEFE